HCRGKRVFPQDRYRDLTPMRACRSTHRQDSPRRHRIATVASTSTRGKDVRMSWLGLGIALFAAIVLSEGLGERGWGLAVLAVAIGWLLQRLHTRIAALEAQLQALRAAPAEGAIAREPEPAAVPEPAP